MKLAQLSNNRLPRPIAIILTFTTWALLVYLFSQPVQIPLSTNHSNLLRFSITHPATSSPMLVDKTLTIPLENMLRATPGLKNIHSVTNAGNVVISLYFYTTPDPGKIQSWIYEQMRNHSRDLPRGLRLPIIYEPRRSSIVHLSGHLWSNFKMQEELIQHLKLNGLGLQVRGDPPPLKTRLAKAYNRYSSAAAWTPETIQYSNYALRVRDYIPLAPGIHESKNKVLSIQTGSPKNTRIVNGQPQISLHIDETSSQIEAVLKKWPRYNTYRTNIHMPVTKKFWEYPSWSAGIILIVATWVLGKKSVHEILMESLLTTAAIVVIMSLPVALWMATLIYFLMLMIPFIHLGRYKPPGPRFIRVVIIGIGLVMLFQWPEEPPKKSNEIFNQVSAPEVRFSIHGIQNHESRSTLLDVNIQRLNKSGISYVLMSNSNSIQGKLTTTQSPGNIRKWLIRLALNTSGAFWNIDTPNNAVFDTFISPLFPAQYWTLSGTDYPALVEESKRIKQFLNRYPGVWDVQITNNSWDQGNSTCYWRISDRDVAINMENHSISNSELRHSRVFTGRKAIRGNQLFTEVTRPVQSISKRDRIYFINIGHEFRGSNAAKTRLEESLRNELSNSVFLNAFMKNPNIPLASVFEVVFLLVTVSILSLAVAFKSVWLILEIVLASIAMAIIVLSIHYRMDVPVPLDWATYMIVVYVIALWNEFRSIPLAAGWAALLLVAILQHFLPLEMGWFLLLASCLLVFETILQVPKWTSAGSLLPRPWNDLRFSRRS